MKLKLETITLPNSGIKCKLALTYKEQITLQRQLMSIGNMQDPTATQDPDKMDKILDWQQELYKTIIKEWDAGESITKENIGELSTQDTSLLQEKANEYLNPGSINKKKEVNTDVQS